MSFSSDPTTNSGTASPKFFKQKSTNISVLTKKLIHKKNKQYFKTCSNSAKVEKFEFVVSELGFGYCEVSKIKYLVCIRTSSNYSATHNVIKP